MAAVTTLVIMFVLLGFAALTVDAGFMFNIRANAQDSADSAALAAATALIEEANDEVESRAFARHELNRWPHPVNSNLEVQIGKWDTVNQTFTPADDPSEAYAVRVVDRRPIVPLMFARIFGRGSTSIAAEAVALGSRPCEGVWGLEGVRIPGSVVIDSYDSTEGLYSPGTAGSNGDVCSGRDIVVSGNAEINGDTMPAFGYATDVNGNAVEITGTTSVSHEGTPSIDVDLDDVHLSNDNHLIGLTDGGRSPFRGGYNLTLASNATLDLPPGEYLFDSIRMASGSTIRITGETAIYVEGEIAIHGTGFVNVTEDPTMLTVYSAGDRAVMAGSADFYGALIAPNADAEFQGTSDYYGMVIAGTLTIRGDFTMHIDETLVERFGFYEMLPPTLVK